MGIFNLLLSVGLCVSITINYFIFKRLSNLTRIYKILTGDTKLKAPPPITCHQCQGMFEVEGHVTSNGNYQCPYCGRIIYS